MTRAHLIAGTSLFCVSIASAQQPTRKPVGDTARVYQPLRLYLSPIRVDSGYRLTPNDYSGATHVQQTVDFADLRDSARVAAAVGGPTRALDTRDTGPFVRPPHPRPVDSTAHFPR